MSEHPSGYDPAAPENIEKEMAKLMGRSKEESDALLYPTARPAMRQPTPSSMLETSPRTIKAQAADNHFLQVALNEHKAKLRQVFMQASREFTGLNWTIEDDAALDAATQWLCDLRTRADPNMTGSRIK